MDLPVLCLEIPHLLYVPIWYTILPTHLDLEDIVPVQAQNFLPLFQGLAPGVGLQVNLPLFQGLTFPPTFPLVQRPLLSWGGWGPFSQGRHTAAGAGAGAWLCGGAVTAQPHIATPCLSPASLCGCLLCFPLLQGLSSLCGCLLCSPLLQGVSHCCGCLLCFPLLQGVSHCCGCLLCFPLLQGVCHSCGCLLCFPLLQGVSRGGRALLCFLFSFGQDPWANSPPGLPGLGGGPFPLFSSSGVGPTVWVRGGPPWHPLSQGMPLAQGLPLLQGLLGPYDKGLSLLARVGFTLFSRVLCEKTEKKTSLT